jgi:hypothetical protein
MKKYFVLTILVSLMTVLFAGVFSAGAYQTNSPSFSISDVVVDKNVSILARDFPADTKILVQMRKFDTQDPYINVAKFNTQAGGSFTVTFPIPEELHGVKKVELVLTDQKELVISSFFEVAVVEEVAPTPQVILINPTSQATVEPPAAPVDEKQDNSVVLANPTLQPPAVQKRAICDRCLVPMFRIVSVQRGKSVEIETLNFPLYTDFVVRMGYFTDPKTCTPAGCFVPAEMKPGNIFVGYEVGTYSTGENASEKVCFNIPAAIQYLSPIYIRFDEACGGCGYYSFNFFWNNTHSTN